MLTLNLLALILDFAFDDEDSAFSRILVILLVQIPRAVVEFVFQIKLYNEEWARNTYIVRVATIVISIILIIVFVILIAVFGDDLERGIGIPATIIFGCIFTGIDIYLTMMYYYYMKNPDLRVDRQGNGPDGQPAQNGNGNPARVAPASNPHPNVQITYLPARQPELNDSSIPIGAQIPVATHQSDMELSPDPEVAPSQEVPPSQEVGTTPGVGKNSKVEMSKVV